MLHWLHSSLPDFPHYGYALVFIVAFLNNIGAPLPGETILLGAGFVLGRSESSLWQPIIASTAGCFLGGICAFWLGRRLGQSGIAKFHWPISHQKEESGPKDFSNVMALKSFLSRGSSLCFHPSWPIFWQERRQCGGGLFFSITSRARLPMPSHTS